MSADKLGLGMSEYEKRIEELEYILAGVMHFVDKWLEADDFDKDEVNRAAIAREKALKAIEARDEKIRELENRLKRSNMLADERAEAFNKQFDDAYFK